MGQHIAIAGNIGSGKTTLTRLLAKANGWTPQYESVEDNPYLDDFYEDMDRWAFNIQVHFLNSRFQQVIDMQKEDIDVIQDRTIYEDAEIFAPNLKDMGHMSQRDYNNYKTLFKRMTQFIKPPDLLIYLKSSVPNLVNNIRTRSRDCENTISLDYLGNLNDRYDEWISRYDHNVLVIEADGLDFLKPDDFDSVLNQINETFQTT